MKTGSLQVPEHQHIKEDLQMENIVLNNKLECPVVAEIARLDKNE